MSVLSICQNVLDIVGWDSINSISSNTDKTARQILALANQELRNVSKRFDWRHLHTEYNFTSVPNQSDYELPEDFDKLMQDSVYNKDEYYRVRSSMTDYQWNAWRFGLLGSLSHQRYQVSLVTGAPVFVLSPAPDTAEDFVLWYKNAHFARDNSGVAKAKFELDTDVSRIPENVVEAGLLWRFRRAKGLDFSAELAEYNEISRTTFAQSRGESDLPIPNGLVTPEITNGYVPDSGFGG
jgi:hypothetical protein